jgi:hypothetical protein
MPDALGHLPPLTGQRLLPVNQSYPSITDVREQFQEACRAWLARSPSRDTCADYDWDLAQFMAFAGIPADRPE